MIIRNPPKLPSSSGIDKYVQIDLYAWLISAIASINGNLDFDNNFNSFIVRDLEIAAGDTALIDNQLRLVPTERYIVRQIGDGVITDGDWDLNTLRLVNNGAVAVTISVRFFYFFEPGLNR
jgi:hypothetical protein